MASAHPGSSSRDKPRACTEYMSRVRQWRGWRSSAFSGPRSDYGTMHSSLHIDVDSAPARQCDSSTARQLDSSTTPGCWSARLAQVHVQRCTYNTCTCTCTWTDIALPTILTIHVHLSVSTAGRPSSQGRGTRVLTRGAQKEDTTATRVRRR